MPLLLEQNEDVAALLRLQLATHGEELHHVRSVEDLVGHLGSCIHEDVLIGGDIEHDAWHWIFGAVPDGARVTLWSSHPASRVPKPPAGRAVRTELLLGMPRVHAIVARLLPDRRRPAKLHGIA